MKPYLKALKDVIWRSLLVLKNYYEVFVDAYVKDEIEKPPLLATWSMMVKVNCDSTFCHEGVVDLGVVITCEGRKWCFVGRCHKAKERKVGGAHS